MEESRPSPLPPLDPWTSWQTPVEHRLPFNGKMASPTSVPSAEERLAVIQRTQKARRRRGFLFGLLAGQILIIAMDFGGELLIRLLHHKVRFQPPPGMSVRSLVFIGMTAGIAITGLLIFLILGLSGAGYVLGRKKAGLFTAVGRGAGRVFKATWALGLTLGVIGGTAWFLIPRPQWKPTAEYLRSKGENGYRDAKGWVESQITPPPGK
jgi:hypothetical protein